MRYMKARTHFFDAYDPGAILEPADHDAGTFTHTKVMFTVGPACQDVESLMKILQAGATSARIDLTWGPVDFHEKSLENLQVAMKNSRRLCAIVLDTLGREVFVKRPFKIGEDGWPYHGHPISIKAKQTITLTTKDVPFTDTVFPLNYSKFPEVVEPGDSLYVSRYLTTGAESGALYLKVLQVTDTDVVCEAQTPSELDGLLTVFHMERNQMGPVLSKQNTMAALQESDKEAIRRLSKKFDIDFIALSYARDRDDVIEARKFLEEAGMHSTRLIAKVETKYTLTKFKGILSEADAIMISRGNLGTDCPVDKMALIQKNLISSCNLVGKPVLVTRLVDTMVSTPRPTRAEATDVANAVLDGADGFLLGAETLRGLYAVETIHTVLTISRQAETMFDHRHHFDYLMQEAASAQAASDKASIHQSKSASSISSATSFADLNSALYSMTSFNVDPMGPTATGTSTPNLLNLASTGALGSPYLSKLESIASSAVRAADKINASLLVVYTHSGQTAQLVAKYRPSMPIMTLVVPSLKTDKLGWKLEGRGIARQCMISRGLMPMLAAPGPSTENALADAVAVGASKGLVKPGDMVVVVQRVHEDFVLKIVAVDDLDQPTNLGGSGGGAKGWLS
ncbi:unnamed protein product [Ostreobium quekettii]|uniref:Pyruvate kinase n=1 Tax=Ostreobium quekettii TaxID=121088 RepID=A0A8S1IXZ8_9CHLO|nr:unnamed protein product [Ostreobium quekettii]|eukprot:evm.model.scf_140.4 EVM.evm.TU.scf_140.4   scf_140:84950-95204(-)